MQQSASALAPAGVCAANAAVDAKSATAARMYFFMSVSLFNVKTSQTRTGRGGGLVAFGAMPVIGRTAAGRRTVPKSSGARMTTTAGGNRQQLMHVIDGAAALSVGEHAIVGALAAASIAGKPVRSKASKADHMRRAIT